MMEGDEMVIFIFRSLISFFSLDYENQLKFLPLSMTARHIEWGDGQFYTDKPLKAVSHQLQNYSYYPAVHGGTGHYVDVDSELCSELRSLITLINDDFNFKEQIDGMCWETSTLDQPVWNLVRRLSRLVSVESGWATEQPRISWDKLIDV